MNIESGQGNESRGNKGKLFVIATPIGHLKDISFRAIETIKEVDLLVCEDTRQTLKLLNAYGISKQLVAFHEHNEDRKSDEIIQLLKEGKKVGIVSDAGMPLISDPGWPLVQKAIAENIEIDVIPGPAAFLNALVLSGLPVDKFVFLGFLPQKNIKIQRIFEEIKNFSGTVILYESPYRVLKTLELLEKNLVLNKVVVVKELTKIYQTVIRGTISEVRKNMASVMLKGEFVILYTLSIKNVKDFKG